MRKWLKRTGIGLGGLVAALVLAAGVVYAASEAKMNEVVEIPGAAFVPSADPAQLARGEHMATAIGKCGDCHGADLGGKVFIEAGPLGTLIASNLTTGKGGVLGKYDDAALERAIRHGVRFDGKPLVFMPSHEYYYLTDADVSAIMAYMRTLPPVDRELPATTVGPLGRTLFLAGKFPLLPAQTMDHAAERPTPAPGATVEYGAYLAMVGGCRGCHGMDLAGKPTGEAPGTPPPPNLTRAGLGSWTERDFHTALKTGKRPDGSTINTFMPWMSTAKMTDEEIRAVWLYLQSVPAKETPKA